METFTELKSLSANPHYHMQRQRSLHDLSNDMIDLPIIDLVNELNQLPYCFTLQSCFGHFVSNDQTSSHNLAPLGVNNALGKVKYRIAYIALCIENSHLGKNLLAALKEITTVDPENVQFFCADWFWERQVNSYALQVMPDRFKRRDTTPLEFKEALHIEKIRNEVFNDKCKFVKVE